MRITLGCQFASGIANVVAGGSAVVSQQESL